MSTGDLDLDRLAAARPSRAARLVSAVLTPALTLPATCAYVALRYDSPGRAALWWLITIGLIVALPYAVLFAAVRAGRVDDHHVVRRGQRLGLMAFALGCAAGALGLLAGLGAPRVYLVLVITMVAGLLVTLLATRVGKPSTHLAVATSSVVVLATEDVRLLPLAVLLLPLGWARVREGRHSTAQVIGGVVIGVVVTGALYPWLR